MDISILDKRYGTQLEPRSIHGVLWLQTHFESKHWESIINGLVIIPTKDAQMLMKDARKAGLDVSLINSLTEIDKI